jgi:hypothetical protein
MRVHGRHDGEHESHRWVGATTQHGGPTGRPHVALCGERSTAGSIILQLGAEARRFSLTFPISECGLCSCGFPVHLLTLQDMAGMEDGTLLEHRVTSIGDADG